MFRRNRSRQAIAIKQGDRVWFDGRWRKVTSVRVHPAVDVEIVCADGVSTVCPGEMDWQVR